LSPEELDKELGAIPQPERIMLAELYVQESRVEFPEEMMLHPEQFTSFIDHTISHHQSKGFHVIEISLKPITEDNTFHLSRTLLLKVAELPKTINKIIKK